MENVISLTPILKLIFMQICIKFNLYYLVEMNLIIQIFILYSSEFKLQSGSESPGMFVENAKWRF